MCATILSYISEVSGGVLTYDGQIFEYDWDPTEELVDDYLNNNALKDELYEAIHISDSPKDPKYQGSSTSAYLAYQEEEMDDYTEIYSDILERGLPVLIYAGEYDIHDGPYGIEAWVKDMDWIKSNPEFYDQSRQIYFFQDENDGEQKVGGYFRQYNNFALLAVPKSGHFVPNNYFLPTKQFLTDYIESQKLVCHDSTSQNCRLEDAQMIYMNNCNGNGQNTNGFCVCDDTHTGADCSADLTDLGEGLDDPLVLELTGLTWVYVKLSTTNAL